MENPEWWERFYSQYEDVHEWYSVESVLLTLAMKHLAPSKLSSNVLHIGCGTSLLGHDLRRKGFPYVFEFDFAANGVSALQVGWAREVARPSEEAADKGTVGDGDVEGGGGSPATLPSPELAVMDATSLPLRDGTFGAVVDKGTLDALVSGPDKALHAGRLLSELCRVTSPDAILLLFSIFGPDDRLPLLLPHTYGWDVEVVDIPVTPLELPSQPQMWLYVLTKG